MAVWIHEGNLCGRRKPFCHRSRPGGSFTFAKAVCDSKWHFILICHMNGIAEKNLSKSTVD